MKLSVMSEVANPKLSNMDGVDVSVGSRNFSYKFKDPNFGVVYTVYINEASAYINDFRFKLDPVYDHVTTNDPGRKSYSLGLRTDNINPYEKTEKGNFGFVYGKLMACVIDFFVTRNTKVLFLQFTGMTQDMELVYKRIMDRLNAEYPSMAMHPYEPDSIPETPVGYYISIDAIENIKDENLKQQAYNSIQGQKHSDRLKKIKERKKARDPKDRGEVY